MNTYRVKGHVCFTASGVEAKTADGAVKQAKKQIKLFFKDEGYKIPLENVTVEILKQGGKQ